MKTKQNVIETYWASIDAQIDGNKDKTWGNKESVAVEMDIVVEFAPDLAIKTEPGTPEMTAKKELVEAIQAAFKKLVNPSACLQHLVKKGKLNERVNSRSKNNDELYAQL